MTKLGRRKTCSQSHTNSHTCINHNLCAVGPACGPNVVPVATFSNVTYWLWLLSGPASLPWGRVRTAQSYLLPLFQEVIPM